MARNIAAHEILDRSQALLAVNASALVSLDAIAIDHFLCVEDNRRDIKIL